jgi:2'-5' RNA ligase
MSAKYFIAIIMPSPVLEAIENLKARFYSDHGLKGALRSPAHLTLHMPFLWDMEKEVQLISKLKEFRFSSEFEIVLSNFAFFEPRVIYVDVLPSPQLEELHAQLTKYARSELQLFNEADNTRGFHPHITVAFRDLKKQKFRELKPEFERMNFSATFECRGFSLLRLENKWRERWFFPFRQD